MFTAAERKSLEEALATTRTGSDRSPPSSEKLKSSAVLVLLGRRKELGETCVLLTKRSESLESHAGEISFPGGQRDLADADLTGTALRETQEEVGISPDSIEIVGALPGLQTLTSGFLISPFVGFLGDKIPLEFRMNSEIERVFWVPLSTLRDPRVVGQEPIRVQNFFFQTPVYRVEGERVWGATAFILSDLLKLRHRIE